jgi:transketolase
METMRERFARVTTALLDEDPRLAVVLAEITAETGAWPGSGGATWDRVINLGIREQLLISVASGLASRDAPDRAYLRQPLVERPFEQTAGPEPSGRRRVLVSAGRFYDISLGWRTHQPLATWPRWTRRPADGARSRPP